MQHVPLELRTNPQLNKPRYNCIGHSHLSHFTSPQSLFPRALSFMHSPLLRLNVVPRSNVPLTIDHCCGMIALSISPLIGYYQATVSFMLCKLNKRGRRKRNERGGHMMQKGESQAKNEGNQTVFSIKLPTLLPLLVIIIHVNSSWLMHLSGERIFSVISLSRPCLRNRQNFFLFFSFLFFFSPFPFGIESCQGIGEP